MNTTNKLLEAELRTVKWAAGENIRFPDYRTEEDIIGGKVLTESDNYWWGYTHGRMMIKPMKFTTPTQYRRTLLMGQNHNPTGKNQYRYPQFGDK